MNLAFKKVWIFTFALAFLILFLPAGPASGQATYDRYFQNFGCLSSDHEQACVTVTGSAGVGVATFRVSSLIVPDPARGDATKCPRVDYSGFGGASGWSGEVGCDGSKIRSVSGPGDGGGGVLTGVGGVAESEPGFISWTVPYSGEPERICYFISWDAIGNAGSTNACLEKEEFASMDVSLIAGRGATRLTAGDSAVYRAGFDWTGDEADWLFELFNPSGIRVQFANGALTVSPETKSVTFNQFTVAGTYKACATGSALVTGSFEDNDSECIDVVVEPAPTPRVDLKADGVDAKPIGSFGGPLRKEVGESASLTWTTANAARCESVTDSNNPAGGQDDWLSDTSRDLNKSAPGIPVTFTKPGFYKLLLSCNPVDEVQVDVSPSEEPDLNVTDHRVSPSALKPGDSASIFITIGNIGTGSAGSSNTHLRVTRPDGEVINYDFATSPLGAGESIVIGQSVPVSFEGNYTYEITADSADAVDEGIHEDNNTASGSFESEEPDVPPPDPSLSVLLSASPRAGRAPLIGVSLSAVVSGDAEGPIEYVFYCDRPDEGVNITNPWSARYYDRTFDSITSRGLCEYPAAGNYTGKVIVLRDGLAAEDRVTINVTGREAIPPSDNAVLNVESTGISGVNITVSGGDPSLAGTTDYVRFSGSTLSGTLTAPASSGAWNFANWSGCDSSDGRNCTLITAPGDSQTVLAHYSAPPSSKQCSDGVDNDSDGFIDYPNDPGCSSAVDDDEFNAPPVPPPPPASAACSDGIDNDDDGLIDYPADVGCSSPDDDDETFRFLRRIFREL